jgi:hypothetical protein
MIKITQVGEGSKDLLQQAVMEFSLSADNT